MDDIKKVRVAINGLGRIGRAFLKLATMRPEIDIVAVNDLGDIENLAYLLRYDTTYGQSEFDVRIKEGNLVVTLFFDDEETVEHVIQVLSEPDPKKLPWGDMDIDVVVESTGVFSTYEKAQMHKKAGAKKVVISAPAKDDKNEGSLGNTVLMGVNEEALNTCTISSNGSCTTNAGSPLISILSDKIGIKKAILNTVHGYTATQSIVDGPHKKDFRKGRAAAQNLIPTSTGAAIAVTKALPDLKGKFDGVAVRVPVIAGSIVDVTFIAKKDVTVEEINQALVDAAEEERWRSIFAVTNEPIVSSDILGTPFASIADLSMTRVVDGDLVKVMAWYDNEMGYTYTLVDHVIKTGKAI
jgi:glyceraldehyde 3-phosphate dehydrogenase